MIHYIQILPVGKARAIPGEKLQQSLGFRSIWEMMDDIETARRAGQTVCRTPSGAFYLPENREELEEYRRTMRTA